MSGVARYGLLVGLAVAIIDWILGSIGRALPMEDPIQGSLLALDWALNIGLFGLCGALGYRASGAVRGGAEVAVLAAVVAGGIAAGRLLLEPVDELPAPGASDVVALLALNVALGGVAGIAGAWLARARRP